MTGARRAHATLLRFRSVDRPRIHRRLPVLVIEIANDDCHRRSERLAAADPSDDLRLVMLDLHPPATPVPVLPSGKIAIDARPVEPHTRRHPGDDDGELRSVRLAGGNERECAHAIQPRRRAAPKQR